MIFYVLKRDYKQTKTIRAAWSCRRNNPTSVSRHHENFTENPRTSQHYGIVRILRGLRRGSSLRLSTAARDANFSSSSAPDRYTFSSLGAKFCIELILEFAALTSLETRRTQKRIRPWEAPAPCRNLAKGTTLNLSVIMINLDFKSPVRNLGILFDSMLSMKNQLNNVKKKPFSI